MKKSEIIALIEQTAIANHESEMAWFKHAQNAEDEKAKELYMKFSVEHYHKESALCDLLDRITGIEGHGVVLDVNCEYMITVI